MTKGDVLVATSAGSGDAMRGRFGRLSIVVSDASVAAGAAAVACSSCRRFFADLSSLVFFVFADFGVLVIFSVDIVRMRWIAIEILYRNQKNVGFTFQKVYAQTRVSSVHALRDPQRSSPFGMAMTFVKLSLHLQRSTHRQTIEHLARNPPQTQEMSDDLLSLAGWYILPNVSHVSHLRRS